MTEHHSPAHDFTQEVVAVEVPRWLVLKIERAWELSGVDDYIVQAVTFAQANGWTPTVPPSNILPSPRRRQ